MDEKNIDSGVNNIKTQIKSAEEIKNELEHPEDREAYVKEKMLEDARKRAERLDTARAMKHTFESNGWEGLDGGHRHVDLAPDSAGRKLKPWEILFCRYYVSTGKLRESLALAGRPATANEMKIIHRPEIKAFISEISDLRLRQLGYDKTTVIKNLAIIGNQDVKDYMSIKKVEKETKDGKAYIRTDIELKDLDEVNRDYARDEYGDLLLDINGNPVVIDSEKTRAIKSIRYNDNGHVEIQFHDKLQALKQLANMLDMEAPTKITLQDETKREQTNQSILKKLEVMAAENKNTSNTEENKTKAISESANDINEDTPDSKEV